MSVFYRDIDVNISDYKSELSKPLIVYERDRGLEIYFNLIRYAYRFDKNPSNLLENLVGAYATVTLVNPSGYEIGINEVEITEDAKVKFVITEDLTDELTEIGIYQLQIHVNNDVEGKDTSVFSVPPFKFEVRERLKGKKSELLDSEGNRLTDEGGYQLVSATSNKIINFSADQINKYLSSIPTIQGEIKGFNSQLEDKTNKTETQMLQNQVNNLVLGAVGDGNNAEVVASRGDFNLLGNRLDDFDARTDSLVNTRNVFPDKCTKSKSWGVLNGDYTIGYGSSFSNSIKAENGDSNILLYKDISISKIPSGNYVFNLKCLNDAHDFNLFILINIVGYPTSVNSGGTVLYTYRDLRVYNIDFKKEYQKSEIKFNLNTDGYDHCRFIIELRTKNRTYNLTDIYLGLENTECNDFSYIDFKLSNILNKIDTVKSSVDKLKGKSLYLDGDSITFGAGFAGGYGKLLADKYGSINTNNAITGATLATGTTYSDGSPRHYISESVVNSVNKQYDYMILSGGFNDYGNNVPIGTLSSAKFCFTNPVSTDNVIGALETMFRHILQNYPTTKLFFLITHKANRCATETNSTGKTMQDYVDAIKSVCNRYSVPIINMWEDSKLITVYDNIANAYTNNSDRVHPNELGYKEFYLPVIERKLGL